MFERSAQAAECSQSAVVEKAAGALIEAARAGSAAGFAKALETYADMNAIALFAIGKHRKALPAPRQQEFVALTTKFVSRTFNDYRLKFRAQSLTVTRCNGDKIIGNLEFLGGKPPQPVTWRMNGGRIADINIQNVWLGQLLRKNFETVMAKSNGDIDALFTHMKKQIQSAT
ncbi:MAG: ABC transporter substrate-binding protein [Rhizobiales bacterium]|nr:ABC transporter substrate-binding protein [Hyphomicrobiales bacterium]